MASHARAKPLVFWDRQFPYCIPHYGVGGVGYRIWDIGPVHVYCFQGLVWVFFFYFLNYGEMDEKLFWYDQVAQPLH